jgi:hypothetical protein
LAIPLSIATRRIRGVFVCLSSLKFDRKCVDYFAVYASFSLGCVVPFSSYPTKRERQASGVGHAVCGAVDDDPSSNVAHDIDE